MLRKIVFAFFVFFICSSFFWSSQVKEVAPLSVAKKSYELITNMEFEELRKISSESVHYAVDEMIEKYKNIFKEYRDRGIDLKRDLSRDFSRVKYEIEEVGSGLFYVNVSGYSTNYFYGIPIGTNDADCCIAVMCEGEECFFSGYCH